MYISRTVFQNPILSERMLQKFITRIIVKQHVESWPFAVTVRFQFWGRGQKEISMSVIITRKKGKK